MDSLTSGLALYMSLCLLVTLSAVESNETVERNETFYITNGTALTNVMCGKVAESAVAMEWFIYKDRQWAKMMKCYNDSSKYSYYSNYTNNTYECVHTSLVIKNIKLSALLKCNCVGNSITHSSTIMVIVVDPIEVSIENPATPAVEYTTRSLTCRINNRNPLHPMRYNYTWMYRPTYTVSATYIPPPNGSSIINGGNTLQLKNLGYKDMAGTYKCTVNGVGGPSSGNITLEVYYAAKLESTHEDMTVYAALEAPTNLTVKFRINPINNYTVSWSMGETKVKDDDIINTRKGEHVQTTYSILYVTKPQLGKYTVQVINKVIPSEFNQDKFIVVLALSGSPEKPINVTIVTKTHYSITVGWIAGLNGGSEQHFKVRYREKNHENWKESQESISGLKTGKNINYTINGLDAETVYEITVVAINEFNSRSESQADVQTFGTKALPVGNSSSIIGIPWPVVVFLVIIVLGLVVTVVVLMWRKQKKGPQDDSEGISRVENEYQMVPRVQELDPDELPLDTVGLRETRREVEGNQAKQKKKRRSVVNDPPVMDDDPLYAQPNSRTKQAKNDLRASGSKETTKQTKRNCPVTNDPKVVDDEAIYAQPKKGVKKAKHDTQANKRKGKSPTGKGKKSRPKHSAYTSLILPAGDGNLRQSMEMSNRPVIEDDEQVVYMNTREAQKQDNPKSADGTKVVYADLTIQHAQPASPDAVPDTEKKVTYASVEFDRSIVYNLEDKE